MNWYKRAEDEDYMYPDKGHDYDPNWDYHIWQEHEIEDKEVIRFVNMMIEQWNNKLFPQLKLFRTVTVHFGNLPAEQVATYANGTVSEPVVIVDIDNIKMICKEMGDERYCLTHVGISILHEIGHAIQEAHGKEFEEDSAEEFGREYFDHGRIIMP